MEKEKTSKKLKTSSSSSSSSDIVSNLNLPSDLLPEVLAKLPIKSLCRFKCVSKYIKSLIKNPVFVDNIRPKNTSFNWAFDHDSNTYISDCHVFTLEKNASWRQVRNISQIRWLGGSAVTANEAVFWFNHGEEGRRIFSFNFATENFGIIKLPNMMSNKEKDLMSTLFEFEGRLCLVEQPNCTLDGYHLEIVNMWMLKDIGNNVWVSIVKKNTILHMEGTCLREQFAGRNGEIMITASDSKTVYIFLYSLLNGQFKRIKASGLPFLKVTWKPYVENYLSFQEFISHDDA
ncbi:hypothetical protein FRX31_013509 [Thalictrum thalictroides]|uniref:F-box domain-containing protein n=1 Tax=Thalictrum thalictroides TaxID=46969 RepID=A0A7J6WIV2_THATH|nr:hypothetical protein FRX31_013509 [Thalictrum thalictroides]